MEPDGRAARLARVRAALREQGLDALIVSHLPNIRYLTGFTGSAAVVLVLDGEAILLSDSRYAVQAESQVGGATGVQIVERDLWGHAVRALLDRPGLGRVGYEADIVTAAEADGLSAAEGGGDVRFTPTKQLVEALRAVKAPGEVAAIERAARLACAALEAVLEGVQTGQRELEVAAALERELRVRGSEWHPFPTIVASGPRSALPHALATDRVIEAGDWLLLDFGAQVDGYCADISRTVVVGRNADDRQRAVYEVVRQAQSRAIGDLRPGMTGREADALARSVIAARGFEDAFGHSLGHGLGLEVHEGPTLSRANDQPIPPDAVVTVEPGIYLPGWGGVRIEDNVHVTVDRTVLLSDGRTELREVG